VTLSILPGLLDATALSAPDTSDRCHAAAGGASIDCSDVHVASRNESVFQTRFPDDPSAGSAQR